MCFGSELHFVILESVSHLVGLPGREISASQGFYLYTTAGHRKTSTNIHVVSVIRTHDLIVQAVNAFASDAWPLGPAQNTCILQRLFPYRHVAAKGGRKYNSYSFLTSALDGGEWSASLAFRDLAPGKDPRYLLFRRLGGPHSRSGHRGYRKISFASAGDRSSIAWSSSP
jgi:hypothetical protein